MPDPKPRKAKPLGVSKWDRPHYGVPRKPYKHGQARSRLVLCPDCGYYLPPDHTCQADQP